MHFLWQWSADQAIPAVPVDLWAQCACPCSPVATRGLAASVQLRIRLARLRLFPLQNKAFQSPLDHCHCRKTLVRGFRQWFSVLLLLTFFGKLTGPLDSKATSAGSVPPSPSPRTGRPSPSQGRRLLRSPGQRLDLRQPHRLQDVAVIAVENRELILRNGQPKPTTCVTQPKGHEVCDDKVPTTCNPTQGP